MTLFGLVVVWCRNRMNYNILQNWKAYNKLWFDVEIEWITTAQILDAIGDLLWFDVEIEWITTKSFPFLHPLKLWFDVEIEWITTP